MSRIFISYRRSDAAAEAGRIYDALEPHFGRESIFMDVDALEAGEDFRARLREAVEQCQVLLAVISKGWLQATDEAGHRRLDNPADWVRLEIETALARNIRVIPVLSEGIAMPLASELPQSLQPLVYRHAAFVRHNRDFRNDMEVLQGVLQRHFESLVSVQPPVQRAQRPVKLVQRPIRKVASKENFAHKKVPRENPTRGVASVATPKLRTTLEPATSLSKVVSRRRMLQVLGYSGGGLGVVLLGKALLQRDENWKLPNLEPATFDGTTAEFNVATLNTPKKRISVVRDRAEFVTEELGDGVTLELMKIPAGTFTMGSPASEAGRSDKEGPQHNVSVPAFWMGKYPVTQAQWRAVAALPKIEKDLDPAPARFEGDNLPVERVSWWDAVELCQRLSAKSGDTLRLT
ncbi:MAG: SUMF1/EgtB/PvdO family nonheme iron enzyme, partial [Cyanobacteria bacterium J06635_11]